MTGRTVLLLSALVFTVGGGAVHPFGAVKQENATPAFQNVAVDAVSLQQIQRACANCHSENVHWPWYSYVAPASWLIEKDVMQARQHLNFSRWPEYSTQERITLLSAIGVVVRSNAMPPQRYTMLHPESVLSDSERKALYEWAKNERHRLRVVSPQQ